MIPVNVEDVMAAIEVLNNFNALNLAQIALYENGKLVPLPVVFVEEWKSIGLSNRTLLETRAWEDPEFFQKVEAEL